MRAAQKILNKHEIGVLATKASARGKLDKDLANLCFASRIANGIHSLKYTEAVFSILAKADATKGKEGVLGALAEIAKKLGKNERILP